MELYRVLLVDDEEDIRVGISQKMKWNELGFSLVGEAANGQDALELAESLRPDLVLTDIKMPFMDGLELCRILTKRLPASKFVVFSGFDTFDYVKQALQMNVAEYILKPINAEELTGVLQKLKADLDRERAERQDVELLRSRYRDYLPVLRELFFTNLLEGRLAPGTEAEQAERLEIGLCGSRWTAALAYIGEKDRDTMTALSVQKLLEENLPEGCRSFLYRDWIATVAALTDDFTVYDFIGALDRVCILAGVYFGVTLTIGVGAPCTALSQLSGAAYEARESLEYRSMVGRGQVIYVEDLEVQHGAALLFDENDERAITAAIKLGRETEVRETVAALMEKLRRFNPSASQYNQFYLELLTHLMKVTRRSGVEVEEVFGAGFSPLAQAANTPAWETLEDWCVERCLLLRSLIRRRQTDTASRTVELAKEYISRHYKDNGLSVDTLCDYLHLSPTYFSTLFKRETGIPFTSYVTQVRMEAAAEALCTTEEKTNLIALQCGYEDPNYFSYVFKRYFGETPTKYRASHGK